MAVTVTFPPCRQSPSLPQPLETIAKPATLYAVLRTIYAFGFELYDETACLS